MLKTKVLILLIIPFFSFSKVKIKGRVLDSQNKKEPIPYCMVSTKDKKINVSTDIYGNFEIEIPESKKSCILDFYYIGYKKYSLEIDLSNIKPNYDIFLSSDDELLATVNLVEKVSSETKFASLLEQKNAEEMVQSISAEDLAIKGISNAGEGVTKISSVAKVEGKGVFVRGLGDRYNNAMLNQLPIVSDNPDSKIINLALIPSGMIRNMKVYKTFNPHIYGDFAGATIDIETKNDYPERSFFEMSLGSGYNTITTLKDFYMVNNGGLDNIGLGANSRNLPNEIDLKNPIERINISNGESILKNDFYKLNKSSALPPMSIDLFGGNKYNIDYETSFGFMVYGSFENNYSYREGINKFYSTTSSLWDYEEQKWENEKSSVFVINLGIMKMDKYDLSMNIININNANNSINFLKGENNDNNSTNNTVNFRSKYLQTNIFINQLIGKYHIDENNFIDAGVSFSKTLSQEPDRITVIGLTSNTVPLYSINFDNKLSLRTQNSGDVNRFWGVMTDYEIAQKLSYNLKFGEENSNNFIIGLNAKQKYRTTDINRYNPDNITRINKLNNGGISLIDMESSIKKYNGYWDLFTSASFRGYEVNQMTYAGYLKYSKTIKNLFIELGTRFEYSNQNMYYRQERSYYKSPFDLYNYSPFNILPEINIKYTLDDKSNLRLSASNTITRPSMMELRPSRYINTNQTEVVGNPELKNSDNFNFDVKYENFSNGGLFAFAIFGKYIDNPIEQILNQGGIAQTYINTQEAYILGAELDFDESIGRVLGKESLRNLFLGFNLSYLNTQINLGDNIQDNDLNAMTNKERPLQGASPIIINTNISYSHKYLDNKIKSTYSLVFSYFEDRLYSASLSGIGDVYERGYPTLDFIWKNTINKKISLDFKFRNILNPNIELYQKDFGAGSDFIKKDNISYKLGQNISVSLKYNI